MFVIIVIFFCSGYEGLENYLETKTISIKVAGLV